MKSKILSVCIIFVFVLSLCFFANAGNLFSETAELRLPFVGATTINTGSPYHTGASSEAIDFGLAYGQEVYAAGDGKVVPPTSYGYNFGFGNLVKIEHPNGNVSICAHLSEIVVSVGDSVKSGQMVGRVGNSGNVIPKPTSENPQAGKHLHFEVRDSNNQPVKISNLPGISGLTAQGPPVLESKFASANPVRDNANILEQGYEDSIRSLVIDLEKNTTAEVVVVTVNSLEGKTIEKYAFDLFNSWGIGKKDKNNGVLFLVAPNERKCRIEVGLGLEGTITNSIAQKIINESALPNFKAQKYGQGSYECVKRIVDKILSATK